MSRLVVGSLFSFVAHWPSGRNALWALVAVLATAALTDRANALSIELKDAAPDRIERQRAAAIGRLPLPGTPDVSRTDERLAEKGFKSGAAIMLRIFKAESELEMWMEKDGRFELFATYPICHWSGTLGPKIREGDKQTPEGFYTITARQLHHVGRWPRSLNLGFPNAFDQSQKRSGSYILVHGGCSSVGCFAMTNPVISEIYGLAAAALRGGQRYIPAHVFPFRMTDANMKANATSEWASFWANLKEGYDSFERTRRPPRVSVCDGRYAIQDPDLGPLEAGAPSPLAVCGATAAAILDLDKSANLVPLDPSLPVVQAQLEAQPDVIAAALPPSPVSPASAERFPKERLFELVPNLNPPPLPKNAAAQAQLLHGRSKPPCNLGLASCRRYVALRNSKKARSAQAALQRQGRQRLAGR